MRTFPVLSSVKDSLCSYFVYRALLLQREGQWKILLENPPPLFFESQSFVLNSTCHNLGSVKPTTDGHYCTHKSYLLDVVTHCNLFTSFDISTVTAWWQTLIAPASAVIPTAVLMPKRLNPSPSVQIMSTVRSLSRSSIAGLRACLRRTTATTNGDSSRHFTLWIYNAMRNALICWDQKTLVSSH